MVSPMISIEFFISSLAENHRSIIIVFAFVSYEMKHAYKAVLNDESFWA